MDTKEFGSFISSQRKAMGLTQKELAELLFVLPHIFSGVLFAILLLKTKNVTLVYIIHILNNLLPLMTILFRGL